MREKKRLENVLATEAELGRRVEDISAYFDLAREGENVDADLRKEMDALRARWSTASRRKRCSPARMTA